MIKYIVALVALGLFLALEARIKENGRMSWIFSMICGLLGIVGLIIFNTMDVQVLGYFESAFLLIVFYSAVNLFRLCKEVKQQRGKKE